MSCTDTVTVPGATGVVVVVVGALDLSADWKTKACSETTSDELCRLGTRKQPVMFPLKDCSTKFSDELHDEV